jgi:hypothetical protein
MSYKGLAAIVDWLVSRHINNVAAYARRDDKVTGALAFEDLAGVLGAIDNTIDYGGEISDIVLFFQS